MLEAYSDSVLGAKMNNWNIWGDGIEPLDIDVSREQAERLVKFYANHGRNDVYAEDLETGETIESSDD